jgi:hypothetical protein
MMRLPVECSVARKVYEEVRFVHANSVESICERMAKHLAGSSSSLELLA